MSIDQHSRKTPDEEVNYLILPSDDLLLTFSSFVPKDFIFANWKISFTRRVPSNFHEMFPILNLTKRMIKARLNAPQIHICTELLLSSENVGKYKIQDIWF